MSTIYHAAIPVDLAAPSRQRIGAAQMFMGDNDSHIFTALVADTDAPEAGLRAGTVSGTALRADGVTVALEGTKGAEAQEVTFPNGITAQATPCSVTLPQAAFAVPGSLLISIKLTDGTTATTVLALSGTVIRTETDAAVDPGELIPDLATLQAAAAQALDAAEAATAAADHAVQYDAAQSLTDAQTAQARSNIRAFYAIPTDNERLQITATAKNEWVSGSTVVASATHLMTDIIEVDSWVICALDPGAGYNIAAFNYAAGVTDRTQYTSLTGWKGAYIVLQPGERYCVAMQKPGSNISPEDMKHLRVFYGYGRANYTQTPTLASVSTFATIQKPGIYHLAGNIEITSANIADLPAGYNQGWNSMLSVQEFFYNGNRYYLQTLRRIGTPPTQWVRITQQNGTPWNPWTKIMDEPSVTAAINTSTLAGKTVSFYGDSITTFSGAIPSGNVAWYPHSGVDVTAVGDTWWKKTADALGLTVLVNNSYSGREVRNSGYLQALIDGLATDGATPDIIVVLMGINDFNHDEPLGTYDGSTPVPEVVSGTLPASFTDAYGIMLDRIMTTYPLARVYCCTLINQDYNPPTTFPEVNDNGVTLTAWNEAIRKLAYAFGAQVIDLYNCGITHYNLSTYIGDYGDYSDPDYGVHPNAAGMSLMANQAIHQMDGSVKKRY